MRINYTLRYEDIQALGNYLESRNRFSARNRFILMIAAIFIGSAISTLRSQSDGQSVSIVNYIVLSAPVIIFVGIWFAVSRWLPSKQRREFDSDPVLAAPRSILLNADNFFHEDVQGESITKWTAFTDMVEVQQHFFLFAGDHVCHVIPKRVFTSSEDAQEFFQTAKDNWKRAATS